jgi:anti-sigma factor RsiW
MVNCDRFLDEYSSYRDGLLPTWEQAAFRAHLDECAACAHYDRVVDGGVEVLRELTPLEVSDDFGARLQHRIWHEELDRLRGRRRSPALRVTGAVGLAAAAAGVAIGFSIRPSPSLAPEQVAVENAGVGSYFVDGFHAEAGSVSSQLARLGVRVYELPYHDVVYRRDATLVASLAEYAGDPYVVPTR